MVKEVYTAVAADDIEKPSASSDEAVFIAVPAVEYKRRFCWARIAVLSAIALVAVKLHCAASKRHYEENDNSWSFLRSGSGKPCKHHQNNEAHDGMMGMMVKRPFESPQFDPQGPPPPLPMYGPALDWSEELMDGPAEEWFVNEDLEEGKEDKDGSSSMNGFAFGRGDSSVSSSSSDSISSDDSDSSSSGSSSSDSSSSDSSSLDSSADGYENSEPSLEIPPPKITAEASEIEAIPYEKTLMVLIDPIEPHSEDHDFPSSDSSDESGDMSAEDASAEEMEEDEIEHLEENGDLVTVERMADP